MTGPTVLTILLNFRTPDLTLRSAEAALAAIKYVAGEIVIVDNDSGDGSFETIRAAAEARGWLASGRLRVIASGHNGGFGAGMNVGMAAGLASGAAPDFYYLLNSDAFPEAGTIAALRDFLIAHPKAGFAGSFVYGEDGLPHQTAFRFPSAAGEFETAARTGVFSRLLKNSIVALPVPDRATQIDWTAGASLMLRAEMIRQIGGFDETFFLYYEETELCHRAARAGWQCWFVPESRIMHLGSVSTGMKRWSRTPGYWFDSRRYYFTKTHGAAYALAATLARVAGQTIWGLRRMLQGKPQADPDHFLRDLVAHSFGPGLKPHAPASPFTATPR